MLFVKKYGGIYSIWLHDGIFHSNDTRLDFEGTLEECIEEAEFWKERLDLEIAKDEED